MKYLLYIALIVSVALNVLQWERRSDGVNETVVRIDTIRDIVPVPCRITELVPVRRLLPRTDTVTDSVEVYVPVRQVEYRDTAYRAWVSGYEVRLDSIEVYRQTVVLTKYKTKRWGLGVQVGIGFTGRVQPYIGVGLSYNFFSL